MLKKIESSKSSSLKKSKAFYKKLPKSSKVYVKGLIYSDLKVGMRNIKLDDHENKDFVVYDTSGPYSEDHYEHNYDKGLKTIREEWLIRRKGIEQKEKEKLKYIQKCDSNVNVFPSTRKKNFKKKSSNEITQIYFAKNNIVTEEMEYCAIRENEGREKLLGKNFKKKI